MDDVLSSLDEQRQRLAPAFVMIDPFSVAGTPMSVVRRVMANPHCEVYFSLMYEGLNRWKNTSESAPHLDSLFGCEDRRDCIDLEDPDSRRNCFYELYESQLRVAGAKHVVHFDIYSNNRLIYSIFFATQHELGCDHMKAAIWKVAPDGAYEFRGAHVGQLTLGLDPDFEPLKRQLLTEFGDGKWHTIEAVQKFTRSDKTDYHSGRSKKTRRAACSLCPGTNPSAGVR